MADQPVSLDLLGMTAQIVSAHVSNNSVVAGDLPGLIHGVYQSLSRTGGTTSTSSATAAPPAAAQERPQPAVPVKKSVFHDYIVCLEDGKKLKMLKRHLMTSYNLTPDQYRDRWDLPHDYPMVAPEYARRRSDLARKIGLGTKPRD